MNRYIKAMEIGLANEEKGISYFDLKEQLQRELGTKFCENSESTFVYWFIDNFTYRYGKNDYNSFRSKWLKCLEYNAGNEKNIVEDITIKGFLINKFFLNGNASKQYLDYVELQESRIAATQAHKQSNISIWIALIAIVISGGLGTYSIFSSPKPPYEVKVIEDRTSVRQLEKKIKGLEVNYQKENEKLKNELYEAKTTISTLKGEKTLK